MATKNIIREIKLSFEWEDYIEEHHEYKTAGNGEYRISCINCDDTKYKLYINPSKGYFNCFKCDFKIGAYDVFDFVSKTEGISRSQAMIQLGRQYAPTTPVDIREVYAQQLQARKEAELASQALRYITALPKPCKPLLAPPTGPGWQYLLDRGFTQQEVTDLSVHYVPEGPYELFDDNGKRRGNLSNRVVFPVYGGDNALVSWQGRVADVSYKLDDKYLACPDSDLARTLHPYVPPYEDHVVLVEGILDAVAVRRCGKPISAYATFGKHVSKEQIKLLKLWDVREVTLFFDKSDAKKQMIKDSEALKMHFDKINVLDMTDWPKEIDAGDCLRLEDGTDRIREVLSKKIDVYSTDYLRWMKSF